MFTSALGGIQRCLDLVHTTAQECQQPEQEQPWPAADDVGGQRSQPPLLAADIATEARLALAVSDEIKAL